MAEINGSLSISEKHIKAPAPTAAASTNTPMMPNARHVFIKSENNRNKKHSENADTFPNARQVFTKYEKKTENHSDNADTSTSMTLAIDDITIKVNV